MVAKRLAENVTTRQELIEYVSALAASVRAGDIAVENETAADILGAAAAWIRDYDGFFQNKGQPVPETPDWALIAAIFSASLVYE